MKNFSVTTFMAYQLAVISLCLVTALLASCSSHMHQYQYEEPPAETEEKEE